MTDVVATLWGFCHTLRHDGIDYGDYIEQITYLLFLKMADERAVELPVGADWRALRHLARCFMIQSVSARSNPMSCPAFSDSIHL